MQKGRWRWRQPSGMRIRIVDLVSSGSDAAGQPTPGLEGGVVLRSQAALIANRSRSESSSRGSRYRPNASRVHRGTPQGPRPDGRGRYAGESPQRIAARMLGERVLGGLQGPTIAPVLVADGDPNWYAVQIVVGADSLIEAIAELRAIGGSGVVVTPVTYIFEEEPDRYRAMMEAVKGVAR